MSTIEGRTSMRRTRSLVPLVGVLPFLAYLAVFLLIPTVVVIVGAFTENGTFDLGNIRALSNSATVDALRNSVVLSGSTALIGGVLGALLATVIASAPERSLLRRAVLALSGSLAQTGGVSLAFAWMATIGGTGTLTVLLQKALSVDIYGSGWLYTLHGLILVYCYFQIPLMVIVFLPAVDGLRAQWREAAETLGASRLQYLTQVAGPLLLPAFLGSLLLLFANAFAAYATAAALVSQGSPILPLMIRAALTSEIVLGQQHLAYAIALEMIVVVALVMTAYALLLRRSSRWMR
ncbi:ABC transporter permease [Nocardioides nematodiphilus]|uniref:ABC transporter permease n=1 Tax=Nocardioides nematodiphilus TaxID=2849669 RepID=UPI001CD92DC4|nr:ABC transporter permease subunit [Nocardioides nematodiphilus]MCA1982942.1 ABC transporter permease subunit [Nocardioides nematodiphilus]